MSTARHSVIHHLEDVSANDEGGRGYSVEVQGRNIFYAAFLYDESGRQRHRF